RAYSYFGVKPFSTSIRAARSGSSAQTSAPFRKARTARLVAIGYLRTKSRWAAMRQQKYCDQGWSTELLNHDVPDLLRAKLLWLRRQAEIRVDLACGEQPYRLRLGMRHPVDVLA